MGMARRAIKTLEPQVAVYGQDQIPAAAVLYVLKLFRARAMLINPVHPETASRLVNCVPAGVRLQAWHSQFYCRCPHICPFCRYRTAQAAFENYEDPSTRGKSLVVYGHARAFYEAQGFKDAKHQVDRQRVRLGRCIQGCYTVLQNINCTKEGYKFSCGITLEQPIGKQPEGWSVQEMPFYRFIARGLRYMPQNLLDDPFKWLAMKDMRFHQVIRSCN